MLTCTTARLHLRPLTMADLFTTYAYQSDLPLTQYMLFQSAHCLADTEAFIRLADACWQLPDPTELEYAVCLDGRHIGAVFLGYYDGGETAELGWVIARPFLRRGYAEEAARALFAQAAARPGVRRIVAHCDTRNAASAGLARRLGLVCTEEGVREYPDARGLAREYTFTHELAR